MAADSFVLKILASILIIFLFGLLSLTHFFQLAGGIDPKLLADAESTHKKVNSTSVPF